MLNDVFIYTVLHNKIQKENNVYCVTDLFVELPWIGVQYIIHLFPCIIFAYLEETKTKQNHYSVAN